MKTIPLTQGYEAIVDDEDYEFLSQYKWFIHKTTYARASIYDTKMKKYRNVSMHRIVVKPPKGACIDHKNRNGLDNRKCNLRVCTPSQNQASRRPNCNRKYKGTTWRKSINKWQAGINWKRQFIYLGCFSDEKEAAKRYDEEALKLFGEFAGLNFPSKTRK